MTDDRLAAAKAIVAEIAATKLRQRSEDLSAALTIISQRIYGEETHFLLELIQNAEDAGASEIAFVVRRDGIVASNDGRPFDAADVWAIASVGKSTKSTRSDYIGFFGIGFKSVFKISDAPHIASGDFRFAFDRTAFADDPTAPWQIIPLWRDQPPPAETTHATQFFLPFAPRLDQAAIARIAAQFDELDPRLLLFLRRLRRITVDNRITGHRLAVERRDEAQDIVRLRHGRQSQRWRVFRRTVTVPAEVRADPTTREFDRQTVAAREVVVAFAVDAQGNLVSSDDDRLFVFLPTAQRTGLRFLVQGDFLLTAQRDRVQADALWNRWLAAEVVALLIEAIAACREHPRWRTQFYDLVPLPGDVHEPFFRVHIERPLLDACRGQPVGLAASGVWLPPPQLVLAEDAMRTLLDEADLGALVAPGRRYAAPELSPRAQLWLSALGTQSLTADALLHAVQQRAWLERKAQAGDAAWFARLYQALYFLLYERYERQGRRYDYLDARAALADSSFVYTASGVLEEPQQVFFPLAALDPTVAADVQTLLGLSGAVRFVHPRALETATPRAAYRLLADCGVRYPNPREVVERWLLPLYESEGWRDLAPAARDAVVRLLFAWWAADELDLAGRLGERLGALRLRTTGEAWERADRLYLGTAYLPDDALAEVLCGVPYVSPSYLDAPANAARWRAFFAALGVAERPRVRTLTVELPGPAPLGETWWSAYLREGLVTRDVGRLRTAVIDGLAATLATGDAARFARLAQLLAERWSTDYAPLVEARWLDQEAPAGPAAFVYLLRHSPWLPTTLGLHRPTDAYAPPRTRPAELLADLLPLATASGVTDWASGPWPALGLRSSDDPAALRAALAAVPQRLGGVAARERVFALYRELAAQAAAALSRATRDVRDVYGPIGGEKPVEAARASLEAPSGPRHGVALPCACGDASDGLRLLGEDGQFHAPAALYVRDDEHVYARFRDRVVFAATPPGDAPRRYAALLRALGVPSANAAWRAEVLPAGSGASPLERDALPIAPGERRDAAQAGTPANGPAADRERAAALQGLLHSRQHYLNSLAAHIGSHPPLPQAIPFAVVPRLVVRETLGPAEVVAERWAFCAGAGGPVHVRAEGAPAWLELAEALVVHLAWPRDLIVLLRLVLTASADELDLLFRLQGIALVG